MITITKKLDMSPHGIPQVIHVSQYDSDFSIQFKLYASVGTLSIESGTTAEIRGTKGSGTGYSASATLNTSNGTVTVAGSEQMTAVAGRNTFEIVLKKSGKVLGSANFVLLVERAALDADTITDATVLRNLEAIVEGAETATQAADDAVDAKTAAEAAQAAAAAAAEQAEGAIEVDDTLSVKGRAADAAETGDKITGLKEDLDDIRDIKIGKNLIDPDALTVGALQADGTISTASGWANYLTTDFVALDADTNYTFTAYDKSSHAIVEKRKVCVLYDSEKNLISASYQNVNNVAKITVSGDDGAYARFSSTSAYDVQLEVGDISTAYEDYAEETDLIIALGDTPITQVNNIVDDKIGEIIYSLNMVGPDSIVTGAIQENGSVSTASSFANYSTTDFIALDANKTYTFSVFNKSTHAVVTQRKIYLLYDASKTVISGSYQSVNNISEVTINSGSASYARLSAPTLYDMQLEEGDGVSSYIGYEKTMNTKLGGDALEQVESVTHDNLKGKKWAVCGDSFTSGATTTKISSGVYAGQNYVYPYLIGNRTGIEVIRFFASGRTLAFPAEPGTFTNSLTNPNDNMYYQNIPSDADYITIYLGINDEHHSSSGSSGDGEDNTGLIPLGTVDDNTTATYLGAWNVVLTWLITNRPNAHIGMIVTNGNANKDEYRQGQIAIAEKYGIPYIDLNGDARTPAMLRTSNPNIASAVKTALINKWAVDPASNTHPNDAAHLFESTCIENFLRSL